MKKSIKKSTDLETRNATWHNNHLKILDALVQLKGEVNIKGNTVQSELQMPSARQIAEHTGLSYGTVYKHLAKLADNEYYKQHLNKFWILAEHLLMKMSHLASYGDANATRLFMYILTKSHDRLNKAENCKQYIQINNLILTQDHLEQLPRQELKRIEKMVFDLLGEDN